MKQRKQTNASTKHSTSAGSWPAFWNDKYQYLLAGTRRNTTSKFSFLHPQRTVVALSEWFVLNKVIGIPLLPTKVMLAGWLSHKLDRYKKGYRYGSGSHHKEEMDDMELTRDDQEKGMEVEELMLLNE
jgi:hypothetical protein